MLAMNGFRKQIGIFFPNIPTTPITAMGFGQCLPLSVVQLKGKHCQKPHCRNGVVDAFRPYEIKPTFSVKIESDFCKKQQTKVTGQLLVCGILDL